VRLLPGALSRGVIRTPGGGIETPAESFFDVWLQLEIPFGIGVLTTAAPIRVGAAIDSIPLRQVHVSAPGQGVDLLNQTGEPWRLIHAAINLNPSVVCSDAATPGFLPMTTSMRWTLPEGQEEIPLAGTWTFSRAGSSTPIPPGALGTYNTEMLALELTGTSRFRGPIRLIERPETISPGQMILYEGIKGVLGRYYSSTFHVFFEVRDERGGTYLNVDPLVARGTIFPADDGTFHQSVEPVKLLDAPGGKSVAMLDWLGWGGGEGPDNNCCFDSDHDGVATPPCDNDCDGTDPNNFPGNIESCADNRDNNCDQRPDCLEAACQARFCSDLSECTLNDVCRDFACVGQPRDCNDNDACTSDVCEPSGGSCQHRPILLLAIPNELKFIAPDLLVWPPPPDPVISNTYRGRIPQLGGMGGSDTGPYSHTCFESGDAQGNGAALSVDAEEMGPGEIRYYLVSAENECVESGLGWASNGTKMPNLSPCPSPPP